MKFQKEYDRLHSILADPNRVVRFTRHAEDEMRADDIVQSDVMRVLTTGQVTWCETKTDFIIHVEGRDIDGKRIKVVVGLRDYVITLKIITVMELKKN